MPARGLKPFWATADGDTVRLYQGDVLDVLRKLPSGVVQCVITSPPYWGLRDYGTGRWEGGDLSCDHVERTKEDAHRTSTLGPSAEDRANRDYRRVLPADNAAFKATARQYAERCKKCGATRIDRQLGSERSPDCERKGEALLSLRDDLTTKEKEYVVTELVKAGLI